MGYASSMETKTKNVISIWEFTNFGAKYVQHYNLKGQKLGMESERFCYCCCCRRQGNTQTVRMRTSKRDVFIDIILCLSLFQFFISFDCWCVKIKSDEPRWIFDGTAVKIAEHTSICSLLNRQRMSSPIFSFDCI